jgi:hypothetical protein
MILDEAQAKRNGIPWENEEINAYVKSPLSSLSALFIHI